MVHARVNSSSPGCLTLLMGARQRLVRAILCRPREGQLLLMHALSRRAIEIWVRREKKNDKKAPIDYSTSDCS